MVTEEMIDAGIAAVRKLADVSAARDAALSAEAALGHPADIPVGMFRPWYDGYVATGQCAAEAPLIAAAEADVCRACITILAAMGPERTYFAMHDDASDRPGHTHPESGHSSRGTFLHGEEWICVRAVGNHNNTGFSWVHRDVMPPRLARAIRWAQSGRGDGRGGPLGHLTNDQRLTVEYALRGLAGIPIDNGYGPWLLDHAEAA